MALAGPAAPGRSDAQEARLHGHLVQRHLVAIRKTNPDRAAHLADLLGLMAKDPRRIECRTGMRS